MSQILNFDHLCGTEITLDQPSLSPPRTFVLDGKISEDYKMMTQQGYDQGLGAPFAVIKFSCHSLLDPGQQSFMRIYMQIPIDGTFLSAPEVRAQQAISQHTHTELKALATLDRENCTAVPKLLGYTERLQGTEELVPGGYINYVVWAWVPGEPVDYYSFWKRDFEYRRQLRSVFRAAYKELSRCSWQPGLTPPSKLIYDDVTKAMHISGFRGACLMDTEPFSDETYALWGLAKPPDKLDWYLDSSDWTW
ncbi:uncharacterized protein N7479_002817 [Penicillium vulpinum]|uniref:Uncharacterized protein n=1 Tax=Penicillium vulpinum TaxID=29845 RepID=A0A1V6RSL5_9EURO|nr:uncharacterized protein N7479_002817 [Penicillium vulpinum]KAJ5972899.1 hypothetical protein N7479_002817 [Penicillium vulpinum]OQE04771.1 hypothetical protein PENVUL_c030G01994 [Penicillium vulpinum]